MSAPIHYIPFAQRCADAQQNGAFGTDEFEKVTCRRCRGFESAMSDEVVARLAPTASQVAPWDELCKICLGAKVDPLDTTQWCPNCNGTGRV